MKLFLLSALFLFSQTCVVARQHPFFPIKNRTERSLKSVVRATQDKIHPETAVRNSGNGTSTLFEYDAFGNVMNETSEHFRIITQYDPTGKYLIREAIYNRENQDAPFVLYKTELETTFDAQGVRTGIKGDGIKEAAFDSRGRATKIVSKKEDSHGQEYTISLEYDWDGDKLARLEVIDNYPGEYMHYIYSNFDYAFETSGFNPMDLDLTEVLSDSEYGTLIGFDILELAQGEDISAGLKAQAKVSVAPDGRSATRTLTEMPNGGSEKLVMKEQVLFLDEYNSMTQTTELYDDGAISGYYKNTYIYNEYGDRISEVSEEKEGGYESSFSEYYVRTYAEDGHPQFTALYSSSIAPENLLWTEYYDGYIPSSISSDVADGMVSVCKDAAGRFIISARQTQVTGVVIYRADGTFVRSLSVGESTQPISLYSRGLYIVKVSTSQGVVVNKVMN